MKLASTGQATAAPAPSSAPAAVAEPAKSTVSASSNTVSVTVHVSPPGAAVFKYGERLGAGEVSVDVVRGTKLTLVAQLRGYLPRTFVIDGTNNSVNIVLRAPESAPARAAESSEGASKSVAGDTPSASSESEPSKSSSPASKRVPAPEPSYENEPPY
jgi:hypothetical protein